MNLVMPGWLVTATEPPWAATTASTMASPRRVPWPAPSAMPVTSVFRGRGCVGAGEPLERVG